MPAESVRLTENAFVAEQETFLSVNIEAEEARLMEQGKENGAENHPPAKASQPDEVESGVFADVTGTVAQTRGALGGHFTSFFQRLLNILATVEPKALILKIQGIHQAAEMDLTTLLDKFKNESVVIRSEWQNAQKEHYAFRQNNALTHDAEYLAPRSCVLWFASVILVEAALNATLLWDLAGILPAFGQTMLITVVNVLFGASLVGLLFRYNNHVSQSVRRLAWICAPAVLLVLVFNMGVGHYRDAQVEARAHFEQISGASDSDDAAYAEPGFVDYTQKAMENIIESPLGIDSILSALLILVGLGFFSFAAYKWYSMFDSYPGYRKRDLARKGKHKNYKRLVETTQVKIDRLVRDANERIADERTKLMNMIEQHNQLSNRAKTLQDGFANWVVELAGRQNYLVRLYRGHNQRARSEPAPGYFEDDAQPIDGNLAKPPDFTPPAELGNVETVVHAVAEASEKMQGIADTIRREFNKLANMQPNNDK